jgi:hypothetical protein
VSFREGHALFCSRCCLLQHEVAEGLRARSDVDRSLLAPVGRKVAWALAFVVVMFVVFGATLIVKPSGPKPIAAGQRVTFGDWTVQVQSVNWDAGPAPAHAREVLVSLILGYRGSAEAALPLVFLVEDEHKFRYLPGINCFANGPGAGLQGETSDVTLFPGASALAHACFLVAANGLPKLRLYILSPSGPPSVELALRSD